MESMWDYHYLRGEAGYVLERNYCVPFQATGGRDQAKSLLTTQKSKHKLISLGKSTLMPTY